MGRGGKFVRRNGGRKSRTQSKGSGSDDSDEDYIMGEEESDDTEDSGGSTPLVASEESFELDGESSCSSDVRPRVVKSNRKRGVPGKRKSAVRRAVKKPKTVRFSDEEEEDYDSDDDEFVPDADEFGDEEDVSRSCRRKHGTQNRVVRKKGAVKGQKRKRKPKLVKKRSKSKGRSNLHKVISSDDDFIVKQGSEPKRAKKKTVRRKRRVVQYTDSDFMESGSSDFEYTISEEEREFLREAQSNINLTTCLRSSSLSKRLQVDGDSCRQQRSRPERKGKEKVEDPHADSGKQVCGICLSEERSGVVQGILNCCFHYFCFTCIMEWSKVESRCPLCKQRFVTISKETRSDIGISLRKSVIKVPRRDQVYRPSEEEIMTYLNPYENVLCIECQQGGDDELMLLCDICDSSAHTYCVGLGREVPEGNWYCEACKSSEFGSSNPPVLDTVPGQISGRGSFRTEPVNAGIGVEGLDLNLPYKADPQDQAEECLPAEADASARNFVRGGVDGVAPVLGAGASTVSGRRRLRFRIHNLLSSNRARKISEVPNTSLSSDPPRLNGWHLRTEDLGPPTVEVENGNHDTVRSSSLSGERPSCSMGCSDTFYAGLGCLSREKIEGLSTYSSREPKNEALLAEHEGAGPSCDASRNKQVSPLIGSYGSIVAGEYSRRCSFQTAEDAKRQVRTTVKRHLTILSRHTHLEKGTFRDIARHSTHSVLAACGVEHNESMTVPVNPPSSCSHPVKDGDPTKNLIKDCCSGCFDSFIRDVVLSLVRMKLRQYGGS